MTKYSFDDSIGLDNSRYSDLKDLKDLTNLADLANLKELNPNFRSRLDLGFKALKELRGYSSDLESCIYYAVYRLSGI